MARSTFEDFKVLEKIGSGSYGVVYKVVRKVDRMIYAMKEIDLQGMSRKEQEECIRETRVLSSLDSDYIIKYYDSFLEKGKLYIITEYAGNGNLHDYIKKQKQRLPEDMIWKLFCQILLGLNHMHSRKILHRDIKTLNVFLDDGLNVKLGDMGVAKILSTNTNFAKTIVGTPYYLSPELCEDKPYNEKSDVWALGVVLYECCTQRHPFDADNQGALILKILRGKFPPVTGYSPDISDLIKRCLTQNANRRPTTFKLLLLPNLRQKAEELGVPMMDTQTIMEMMEKLTLKRIMSARSKPVAEEGVEAPPPQHRIAKEAAEAVQAVRQLPTREPFVGQGVIKVIGNMDAPPQPEASSPEVSASTDAVPSSSGSEAVSTDKAFVFGSTMVSRPRAQVDVSVSGAEVTVGDLAGAAPADGDAVESSWRVEDAGSGEPQAGSRPAEITEKMGAVSLMDDEEGGGDEDDSNNPYVNPVTYRDLSDHEDGSYDEDEPAAEEAGLVEEAVMSFAQFADEGAEEDEEYEEDYDEEVEGEDGEWQLSEQREQHMRSALMIQKAACLDMIGQDAYNQLYKLLKSNQVDEASMTDLSRLVFKIIPYDKSEVIQMMYKLLYLESQLESGGIAPA
ncbi:hypothetical protein CEUSTIGMA_g6106.t1 [Chlamydomonas eustigma]|uniref:non-specific serine/threonine protein kinase n=1 Tax=Chlamydomonas eustigma TaxID=1157962 RepID=A0A250X6G6_9CHLO|nr:hypothetical protein CEUSTIGMA_g6106.t1 [Chlamydomonas eustigma]|eukprot:GAX78668.1 hypothetical protein CEUSTIGMA_g6106.t1 [Chlamydomonas eustigma]